MEKHAFVLPTFNLFLISFSFRATLKYLLSGGTFKMDPVELMNLYIALGVGSLAYLGTNKLFEYLPVNSNRNVEDYKRHSITIGKTGVGKSVFMQNQILKFKDVVYKGKESGVLYIDLHGHDAREMLDTFSEKELERVIYINAADIEKIIGFNILSPTSDELLRELRVNQLLSVFKSIWGDSIGASTEDILRMSSLAVIEQRNSSILEVYQMLNSAEYRKNLEIKNYIAKNYWEEMFEKVAKNSQIINPPMNKLRSLISTTVSRLILCQTNPKLDIVKELSRGKVVICDFSSGKIGDRTAQLLASVVISIVQLDSFRRNKNSNLIFLVLDEFQRYCTDTFRVILSEARKFNLSLNLATQYFDQIPDYLLSAIKGNIGTQFIYRIGMDDATSIYKYLEVEAKKITKLENYRYYQKGIVSGKEMDRAAKKKSPKPPRKYFLGQQVIKMSRDKYGISRNEIENDIKRRLGIHTKDLNTIIEKTNEIKLRGLNYG